MRVRILIMTSIVCLCAWITTGFTRDPEKSIDLAIIVNTACTWNEVSSVELAKIFKAQRARNPDGVKYLLSAWEPGTSERAAALKLIYKMTDADYERYFLQATFAGTVQSTPKNLIGSAAMRQFVASASGAIGYVFSNEVDATVKVLKVDGKSPGDPGYPLTVQDARAH